MAFSTGNCKMQLQRSRFTDAMYYQENEADFYETRRTIYLCSHQKRLFSALFEKRLP